jgi:NAD(P)-dependent dehydrogenase (short-subunit alcohol dehydrogenase family)|tara:strand:+ start:1627 stop:2313 length:687 start_codon:yes stop_codon:yes gene_type:complete
MKIAITGHTKGIGKCMKDLLEKDGHEVVGASTSTGINVMRTKSVINWIEKENPDVFINNVYAPDSQCHILYQLYEKWQYEDKLIINLSSTSGESHTHFQQMGYNKDWTPYVSDKARLNFASLYLSERYNKDHKCRVTNISPGFVKTQATTMFTPFLQEEDFMKPEEVAEMVQWVINGPKHMQIKVLSFNTGNSTIAARRDRQYETKAVAVNDQLFGQNFSQTWDGKEK